jgi:ribonuclease P protein component
MLKTTHRLTKKKDFEVVFKKGELLKNDFLWLRIVKNHEQKSRFGFVVSKKVSAKATIRNKVKRRLRDAISNQLKHIAKPADVVIIALPGIEKKKFSEIQEAIMHSFKKLKLI